MNNKQPKTNTRFNKGAYRKGGTVGSTPASKITKVDPGTAAMFNSDVYSNGSRKHL